MSPHPSARRSVTPEELAFASMFGLLPHAAAVLASLYTTKASHIKADRKRISEIRAAMDCEAIDTTPEGYHLTDEGRADCSRTLDEFRQWVATETRKAG